MAKRTARGWEIRLRVGKGIRLECNMPGSLTEAQAERREAALYALRDVLASTADALAAKRLLQEVATAATPDLAALNEKLARRWAAEQMKRITADAARGIPLVTFRQFGERWTSGALAKEFPDYVRPKASAADDAQRLGILYQTLGDIPLSRFTLSDAERAMACLPKTVRSANTRRQYAQCIQTLISLAVFPAKLIREDANPLPRKFLPKNGESPTYPFLYPDEDLQLVGGPAPLWRRALYGFATREGMRIDHMLRLRWMHLDLARGILNIPPGKNNKGGRSWAMNDGVCAALSTLRDHPETTHGLGPRDPVFPPMTRDEQIEMATTLRVDLWQAGARRHQLHHAEEGWGMLRFHDLRASFVTIHLALGKTPAWVTLRTGHRSYQVLKRYERMVEVARGMGPFTPLDLALRLRPNAEVDQLLARVGVEVGVVSKH